MRIPAMDLAGECQTKLCLLEEYFKQLAEIGAQQPAGQYEKQKALTASSLEHLSRFRLQFDALRVKHENSLIAVLAGERPTIELNSMEVLLLESIRDMYEQVWENRRARLAS